LEEERKVMEEKLRTMERNENTELIVEEREVQYMGEEGVKMIVEYLKVRK